MEFNNYPDKNEFDYDQFVKQQVYEDFKNCWDAFGIPSDAAIDLRPALFTAHTYPVAAVISQYNDQSKTAYRVDFSPDIDDRLWAVYFNETMPLVSNITILRNNNNNSCTFYAFDEAGNNVSISTPDILMFFERLKNTFDFETRLKSKPTNDM